MLSPREYAVAFESKVPGQYPARIVFRLWAYDVMDAAQSGALSLSIKYPGNNHSLVEVTPPMDIVLATTAGSKAELQVIKLMDNIRNAVKDQEKGE